MKKADILMKKAIAEGVFTGGSLLVANQGSIVFNSSYGKIDNNSCVRIDANTVYDLASLTKPLATAAAVMTLLTEKKISTIDLKVAAVLPLFSGIGKNKITIRNLLCHNSGLPDYKPYFKILQKISVEDRLKALKKMVYEEPLEYKTGTKVVYSDIGYMILAWLIEELSGLPFDEYVYKKIYNPLQLRQLFFLPNNNSEKSEYVFASTEKCPWRKKLITGEVHDDNAWAVGGVCGHAGLFGTMNNVYCLLNEYLMICNGSKKSGIFNSSVIEEFLSENGKSGRTPGFDMPSETNSSSGSMFSKNSVGHLGFTGTSFWLDLECDIIIILLTNRVHPCRDNNLIKKFRPEIHNCVMQILKKKNQKTCN